MVDQETYWKSWGKEENLSKKGGAGTNPSTRIREGKRGPRRGYGTECAQCGGTKGVYRQDGMIHEKKGPGVGIRSEE